MSKQQGMTGAAVAGLVMVGVSACAGGGAAEEAAAAVYDACAEPDVEPQILVHDGPRVAIEVKGDAAKALSGIEDASDALVSGDDDADLSALGVGMSIVLAQECLVEETGYPGAADQLSDDDEWDGWRFNEETGAGSEFTATFTSTS